jgi:histidine ammonia-lyase
VRAVVAHLDGDREPAADLRAATALVSSGTLAALAEPRSSQAGKS